MFLLPHAAIFLLSISLVWFFAGLLIESVNSVAKRFNSSSFTLAFFVLGFLTSISEISVMVNSSLGKVPEVSAGNLVGASFVILLFIIPLLAILGRGIKLKNTLTGSNLGIALLAVLLPAVLILDGKFTKIEGGVCLLVYGILLFLIHKQRSSSVPKIIEAVEQQLIEKKRATYTDIIKIAVGGSLIFASGHFLVREAVFFAGWMNVPGSVVGLIILSIGTNIPELVIAARAVLKKRSDIAFGDYLGSTLTNTLIFGLLPFLNGNFTIEPLEFLSTAFLLIAGLICFYFFAKSKNIISAKEGLVLLVVYLTFLLVQSANILVKQ
jgi:cation:H+ antiporter